MCCDRGVATGFDATAGTPGATEAVSAGPLFVPSTGSASTVDSGACGGASVTTGTPACRSVAGSVVASFDSTVGAGRGGTSRLADECGSSERIT